MSNILIFGGTTEGRQLCEECIKNGIPAYDSVTTDYGAKLLNGGLCVTILIGRMDSSEMSELIFRENIKLVIDATHPYAIDATQNIKLACENTGAEYIRIRRESEHYSYGVYFDSFSLAAGYLDKHDGNILFTTGSKELSEFCGINRFSERSFARVLPFEKMRNECVRYGIANDRIITGKGPFSKEKNIEHIRKSDAKFLVTKESGKNGGFVQKAEAAEEYGTELVVIRRCYENGISVSEAVKILLERKHEQKN